MRGEKDRARECKASTPKPRFCSPSVQLLRRSGLDAQLQRAAAAERRSTAFKAKKSMRETKRLLEENQTLLAMNAELRREIKEMKVNAAAIQRTGGATAAGASAPTRGMHPSSAGGSRPSSAASPRRR